MDELSRVLWRERELLQMLLFKLEEEQLVLAGGRSRWLAYAAREVETVLDSIRQTEVLRATIADAVATAMGLENNASLRAVAEASDEPWRTILLDHREAFVAVTAQISEMDATKGELLTADRMAARETMLSLWNGAETYTPVEGADAEHLGRSVFGGATAGQDACDRTTGACTGVVAGRPGTTVERTTADGPSVRVDMTGPEVFGAGSDDLFKVLDEVVTHLRTDPAFRGGDLDRLDVALARMRTAVADVGTRALRLEHAAQTAKDLTLDLQASLSEVENVDIAKATMDRQLQEVAYQAALATTARTLQPSLVDFLR